MLPGGQRAFPASSRFTVARSLGAGGMGEVYEAFDRVRGMNVALKTLRAVDPKGLLRFKNEFRALQDVHHRNLVSLGELIEEEGQWLFTMELVRGVHFNRYVRPDERPQEQEGATRTRTGIESVHPAASVAERPRRARTRATFDEPRLRRALAQLTEALRALHAAGKIHRDIKPSNVLVTDDERVVVLDFGVLAESGRPSSIDEGLVIGTAAYMAPEQARGVVSTESDWYSVGVVLYQALTGRVPFSGGDILAAKQAHDPPPPSELVDGVPPDLDRLCVDLLKIEPEERIGAAEVLTRLEVEPSRREVVSTRPMFVGRTRELEALGLALADSRTGPTVLAIKGESGVGKSALVADFLAHHAPPGTIALTGRCYEREWVPYKALDEAIDALARHLVGRSDAAGLLPARFSSLVRAFPVLGQLVSAANEAPRAVDAQHLRAEVSSALRALLSRIAEERPLVLAIDDLQWADADSLALLSEVLRGAGAPRMLLISTIRPSAKLELPFPGAREIDLRPLAENEALELAELLSQESALDRDAITAIVREGAGHPLFIDELVRQRRSTREGGSAVPLDSARLDDALWARVQELAAPSRELLEVIAISGIPIQQEIAARTLSFDASQLVGSLAELRVGRFIRTHIRSPDLVEPYHDRVREAVVANLGRDTAVRWHRRVAETLEASDNPAPETLLHHFVEGQLPERAARHAELAAAKAAEGLAFGRAVDLYELALRLDPRDAARRRPLLVSLGEALVNAGRGAQGAEVFRQAAIGAEPREASELRRRAADQLLRSGHHQAGIAAMREVLAEVGIHYPTSSFGTLASLLLHRAQLQLRGVAFVERPEDGLPEATRRRLDAGWSAASGLSMVDAIRAADFQTRNLIDALGAGAPYRIARALAVESALLATNSSEKSLATARELNDQALALAKRIASPHAIGVALITRAVAEFQVGAWKACLDHVDEAETILRTQCTGVTWELATVHVFATAAQLYLGRLADMRQRLSRLIAEADERGDWFSMTNLRVGYNTFAWLASGDVDAARREAAAGMKLWTLPGYNNQQFYDLISQLSIELYEGNAAAAYRHSEKEWKPLSGSMLLRVQVLRVRAHQQRAQAALAAAALDPPDRKALLRIATKSIRQLEREPNRAAAPMAMLLRAGVSATERDEVAAIASLEKAAAAFDATDMALHAAVARRRCAELLGGDRGAAMLRDADRWLESQQVKSPEQMTAMLAPGRYRT
jgi:serine/threonine protein kinase/tetratricopeptide (TPR) repeat protein